MEVLEVDPIKFDKLIPIKRHVFSGAEFNVLNKDKVESVKFITFSKKNKIVIGIVGGVRNNTLYSPFSAPFGGWVYNGALNLEDLETAYVLLEKHLIEQNIEHIKIILPPFFYDESGLALIFNTAMRHSYSISNVDLNFQFDLVNFNDNYLSTIHYNANKNYRIGERSGLTIRKAQGTEEVKMAFDVIAQNRKERGFPLKMSFENIAETVKIIPADFFIVFNKESVPVASAMVFYVTKDIVQVVYWGHIMEFSSLKPVNYLSYYLFDHYKKTGLKFVDIGPSTEDSMPNYGLVEFKESIGCSISSKLTLQKTFIK